MTSRDKTYTPVFFANESSASKDSTNNPSSSSHKNKRKRYFKDNSHGEFRKAKTPTFDGEVKPRQEVEAWLLGMRKYFQFHDYYRNMNTRVDKII